MDTHGAHRHKIGDMTAYGPSRLIRIFLSADLKKKNARIRHPTLVLTIVHSILTLEEFIGLLQGR